MTDPSSTSRGVTSAMVRRLLPSFPALDPAARARVDADVGGFVAGQIGAMPAFLRLPFRLALIAFDCLPLAWRGRRFGRLPGHAQDAYLGAWSAAPIAPMRDLIKLVRSCTLLAFYDHPAVSAGLRAGDAPAAPAAADSQRRV